MTPHLRSLLLSVALLAGMPAIAWAIDDENSVPPGADTPQGYNNSLMPDEEGSRMPVGRIPPRGGNTRSARSEHDTGRSATASEAVTPPPFKLTPPAEPGVPAEGLFQPQTFTLPNGLAFVVIPNHRAPIISHMVWYQVGAADEPEGKSGLAHLLEHLMFKGTPTVGDGEFTRLIAKNGGEDNAFTSWDYTAYFQNIARDRLELVMRLEADRMSSLTLSDDQVTSERNVVASERQQTSENDPFDRLREAMRAAFFVHHPYGRPIIGWAEEIKRLRREDALAFYRTWYSPANAIVVVSGDIDAEELRPIAERTYGQVVARAVPLRNRVVEPVIDAERRVVLRDARTYQPVLMRSFLAPSYHNGEKDMIAPLQVLAEILGGGPTSRLYRRLVMDLRVATGVRFDYDSVAFDLASASLAVTPAPGQDVGLVETALDAVLKDLLINGVSEAELNRAKKRLLDAGAFARDSVEAPAYIFGMTLAAGGDISDVEAWPKRIMAVTTEQVDKAASILFGQKGYVTGLLLPDGEGDVASTAGGLPPPPTAQEVH